MDVDMSGSVKGGGFPLSAGDHQEEHAGEGEGDVGGLKRGRDRGVETIGDGADRRRSRGVAEDVETEHEDRLKSGAVLGRAELVDDGGGGAVVDGEEKGRA